MPVFFFVVVLLPCLLVLVATIRRFASLSIRIQYFIEICMYILIAVGFLCFVRLPYCFAIAIHLHSFINADTHTHSQHNKWFNFQLQAAFNLSFIQWSMLMCAAIYELVLALTRLIECVHMVANID